MVLRLSVDSLSFNMICFMIESDILYIQRERFEVNDKLKILV